MDRHIVQVNHALALRVADIATKRDLNVVDLVRVHAPKIMAFQITPVIGWAMIEAPDMVTATRAVNLALLEVLKQYTPEYVQTFFGPGQPGAEVVGTNRSDNWFGIGASSYEEPVDPRETVVVTGQATVPTVRAAYDKAQRKKAMMMALAVVLVWWWFA